MHKCWIFIIIYKVFSFVQGKFFEGICHEIDFLRIIFSTYIQFLHVHRSFIIETTEWKKITQKIYLIVQSLIISLDIFFHVAILSLSLPIEKKKILQFYFYILYLSSWKSVQLVVFSRPLEKNVCYKGGGRNNDYWVYYYLVKKLYNFKRVENRIDGIYQDYYIKVTQYQEG